MPYSQTAGATAGNSYAGPPKLVIFGGNGFVGSRVTEEAVKTGLSVVSVSRRGTPPPGVSAPWTSQVEWARVRPVHCCAGHVLCGSHKWWVQPVARSELLSFLSLQRALLAPPRLVEVSSGQERDWDGQQPLDFCI